MRRFSQAITLGAATSFPGTARPGDLLLGQAGGIDGHVAVVAADGTPIDVGGGSFVPPNDNLTDLGDASHRFRTLYLGTSITNAGDLALDLTGSTTRVLSVRNSTPTFVCNVAVDGDVFVGADLGLPSSLCAIASGTAQVGVNAAIAGLRVVSGFTGVNCVQVNNAITANAPRIAAYGSDGSIALEIASKGAAPVEILRDDGNTSTVTTACRIAHTTSGGAAIGIGVRVALDTENGSGARVTVGALQATTSNITSGSEAAAVELLPSAGGGLADAGLRVRATAGAAVNGLEVIPAVGSGGIVYTGVYGADADVFLRIRNRGTGAIQLRNSADTQTGWGVEHITGTTIAPIASHAASTAGGAVTINAVVGQFRILAGAGAAPFVISNECVKGGSSVVLWHFRTLDATLTNLAILPGVGGFTVTGNANATADVDVGFLVVNNG